MGRVARITDPDELRRTALLLEQENEKLVEKLSALIRQNADLKGTDAQLKLAEFERQLAVARRRLFGESSEKRDVSQVGDEAKKPARGHGPREQLALPIQEVVHDLDEADKICPSCGGALAEWENQFEEADEIHPIARSFVMRRHKRKKYRCPCGVIETALPPSKLIAGGRYSTGFAIEVATKKYLDHLPLERQVRIMSREGLVVDSQTLFDQILALARVLEPAHERLLEYVRSRPVIGADETRWPLLGGNEEISKRWQVWTITAPDAIGYKILDSRSAAAAREVLAEYAGVVMADGYGAYVSLAKNGGRFTLVHCWAHVRRKFFDIQEFFPSQTKEILDLIGELYAVEADAPTGPPGNEIRAKLREEKSRVLVKRIQTWLLSTRALPESSLGKAIAYARSMWGGLVRFLDDVRIPLDNNAAERAMRGPVIGRKNHYGSKSRRGTEVAAILYSLVESAKLNAIPAEAYLETAAEAGLRGERIPLPHEMRAALEAARAATAA